jgi:hypothetical protein
LGEVAGSNQLQPNIMLIIASLIQRCYPLLSINFHKGWS